MACHAIGVRRRLSDFAVTIGLWFGHLHMYHWDDNVGIFCFISTCVWEGVSVDVYISVLFIWCCNSWKNTNYFRLTLRKLTEKACYIGSRFWCCANLFRMVNSSGCVGMCMSYWKGQLVCAVLSSYYPYSSNHEWNVKNVLYNKLHILSIQVTYLEIIKQE